MMTRVMFQIVASLTDNFRDAIYDHNMFKVQTTALRNFPVRNNPERNIPESR